MLILQTKKGSHCACARPYLCPCKCPCSCSSSSPFHARSSGKKGRKGELRTSFQGAVLETKVVHALNSLVVDMIRWGLGCDYERNGVNVAKFVRCVRNSVLILLASRTHPLMPLMYITSYRLDAAHPSTLDPYARNFPWLPLLQSHLALLPCYASAYLASGWTGDLEKPFDATI